MALPRLIWWDDRDQDEASSTQATLRGCNSCSARATGVGNIRYLVVLTVFLNNTLTWRALVWYLDLGTSNSRKVLVDFAAAKRNIDSTRDLCNCTLHYKEPTNTLMPINKEQIACWFLRHWNGDTLRSLDASTYFKIWRYSGTLLDYYTYFGFPASATLLSVPASVDVWAQQPPKCALSMG